MNRVLLLMAALFAILPPSAGAVGVLGTPVDGSTVSGVSVISGYHCSSKNIEVFIDGVSIGPAGAGTRLLGTMGVCGHTDTGYGLLYNFNNLSNGEHMVSVSADGELFDSHAVTTVKSSGNVLWRTGVSKTITVADFPEPGQVSTLQWVQSYQNFLITRISDGGVRTTAEGLWSGTVSTDAQVTVTSFVLENGETYGLYTVGSESVGGWYGWTFSNGGNISGSGASFADDGVTNVTVSGSFTPQSTINVSRSDGISFTGAYDPVYDRVASLAELAGTYHDSEGDNPDYLDSIPIAITAGGAVSLDSGTCSATGTATPRASGKNVFDVQITVVTGCSEWSSGVVMTGVASYWPASRQLFLLVLNTTEQVGFGYLRTKE